MRDRSGSSSIDEEATVRVRIGRIAVRPTRRRGLRIVEAAHQRRNRRRRRGVVQPGLPAAGTANRVKRSCCADGSSPAALPNSSSRPTRFVGGQGSEGRHTQGLVPVYPASEALSARRLRELVDAARPYLGAAVENLPAWMRRRLRPAAPGGRARRDPLSAHDARGPARPAPPRARGAGGACSWAWARSAATSRSAGRRRPCAVTARCVRRSSRRLPFTLTAEQERVTGEIARDLQRDRPMRRLLQGEVGAGKTVVAALAICQAVEAGRQAALLVPTETLADQHLRTLDAVLAPAGITAVLVTGRVSAAERDHRRLALRSGTAMVAIGTQALLFEREAFARLGPRRRRRATPVRRGAAPGPGRSRHRRRGRRGRAPALHDRDPDPAYAGPDGLR